MAFDYRQRARKFDHAAMPSLRGLEYKPILIQLCSTARQAYAVEQKLLSLLADKLHADSGEMAFGLTEDELSAVWNIVAIGQLARRIYD